jgi:hypothetical protein
MKIQNEDGIWVDVSVYDGVGSGKVQDYYGNVYKFDYLTNKYERETLPNGR